MKCRQFQTYIISLLLVIAFCGTRVVVWDFSDYHDVKTVNIDQADSHGMDMGDVKNKQLVHPTIFSAPFDYCQPEPVVSIISPTEVERINSLSDITPSFPARASPV
jgi:hypothetical protein